MGMALVGCGEDMEDGSGGPVNDQPGPQAQADRTRGRESRAVLSEQDFDQEQGEEQHQAQPRQPDRAQPDGRLEQSSQSDSAAGRIVDPLEWRERYHWRQLAALHNPVRTPTIGGALTIESAAVSSWDPFAAWEPELDAAQSGHLLPLVYRRLVELDVSDRSDAHRTLVQGDLAAGWEWLDATTLNFALRPGTRWPEGSPTEGRPLDAADVAMSYDALKQPGLRQAPIYDAVERIEADPSAGDGSVVFHLREPSAPLMNQMTSPWHVVLPNEIVSGAQPIDLSQRSVGNGPFRLKLSNERSLWVLTRNPTYSRTDTDGRDLPYLDEVRGEDYRFRDQVARTTPGVARWTAWESGAAQAVELDGVADARRALETQPEAQLQVSPPSPSGGPCFSFRSLSEGPFADVRVRTALSMALHRGNLEALAHEGFAAPDAAQNWTFFPDPERTPDGLREWPWEESELGEAWRYDPNQALALLGAAGYSEEQPLQLGIDMPPALNPAGQPYDPGAHRIAEFVADQWEQYLFGVVEVRRLERIWTQFTDAQGSLWFIPDPDPAVDLVFRDPADVETYNADADDLAYGSMHSAGRFNRAAIDDSEIDEWAVAQSRALDPRERADLLERIRLKEQEHVWRILLVNPYGVRVRRENVFNLVDTYYAKTLHLAPDQLKHVWLEP